MRARSSTAQRAAADATKLEAQATETRAAAAEKLGEANRLEQDRTPVADDVDRWHALTRQAAEARSEAERLETVAGRLDVEAEKLHATAAEAVWREKIAELRKAADARTKTSATVGELLVSLASQLDALERDRARVADLTKEASSLASEDCELPELPDEADWPPPDVLAQVAETIAAGPRQPARRAAEEAVDRERADTQRIREIVADRGCQLGGSRETDLKVLRFQYSTLLDRADEVLDLIEAERERQRASYEERQARKGRQPHIIEA